jgi:hypothetical protein
MTPSDPEWGEKRKKGFASYLFFSGIVLTGGPFAVLMQMAGYFFLSGETETFAEYFSSSRTWITFFIHATLFGSIMGYLKWRRNENAFAKENNSAN